MVGKQLAGLALSAVLLAGCAGDAQPVAKFDYMEYRATGEERATPDGQFRNPVLPGFHPDPSLVRVGEDFYLVTSTFAWFPGLPIFHSRDLVNWQLVGHAIDREGQVDFTGLGINRGLFAPAITHDGEKFWILNTCIECGDNFAITAEDPAGPWSDPAWLPFGGIDPSLFFDAEESGGDGSAWIVYNDAPPGEPLYDGHRALWLQRFDPEAKALVGEPILLVNGGVNLAEQPVWAEGPHIYKLDGWYYLLAAEGGTADQHSQTIYRSRDVTGPYEPGPINPILTQRDMPADRPDRVEATGHADIVQLDDGTWWGTFLATRPFEGQSTLMGRETFLLPVRWENGWPLFLNAGEAVPPLVDRPNLPASPGTDWRQFRDDFDGEEMLPDWIGLRTPGPWSVLELNGAGELEVMPGADTAGSLGQPAFTGIRLRHHDAEVTTQLDFAPEGEGDFAGLLAFMDEAHFLAFGIEGTGAGRDIVARLRSDAEQDDRGEVVARTTLEGEGAVELRLAIRSGVAELAYRAAGSQGWLELALGMNVEPLASVHAGLFTGVVIGPYAVRGEGPN
ncbi:glycoside hydrolase family 43 protein [Alteraurantiacibacter aquimixticola]|uniref:Glycoside hydrolase family 43 protein n=1 Tax=Alteraurantiacibacter aquimixticola TaxID=2489173 RepID=A0A4T3F3H3_9SPHN|nr:glycoside hydrolase family 43 protein [Alteraurantiacibacter aquimixticola]TIX50979.1 glycoside hydrolase family 43 protein [Alteraurantiacibacter aquimixticola]